MKHQTVNKWTSSLAAGLVLTLGSVANAILPAPGDIIFSHSGANNPTGEGFTLLLGTGITTPAANPGNTAWRLIDDNPDSDQRAFYRYGLGPLNGLLSPAEVTRMQTRGWMLEWTLDVLTSSDLSTRDVYLSFSVNNGSGDRRYNVHHHETGGSLQLDVNPNFTAADATIAGTTFHSLALINYGGNTDAVTLFVDGNSVLTFSPDADSNNFIFGGSIASLGGADWSQVRFSIVPEPASAVLCLAGGMLLIRRRK